MIPHKGSCLLSVLRIQSRFLTGTTNLILRGELIAPAYNPTLVESTQNFYKDHEGTFSEQNHGDLPTFSMVLPPPNVTGKLHLGHALSCTIQDVIARRNRSLGLDVLWIPGTDHAGIATQRIVEKHLQHTSQITRQQMGRDQFNREVWKWADKHSKLICNQLKAMGFSLDWSEHVFTMDPRSVDAVNHAFVALFDKGLIYRKKSLVNWCHALQSTISDIEIDSLKVEKPTEMSVFGYSEKVTFGLLYKFAYKLFDSDEEVVVCTTMPETMLGDIAVAVHPEDSRYKHLKNKHLVHPFRRTIIPIIFDSFVDMEFGTGAVKITPAHSKVDEIIAQKHNLPQLQVINEEGRIINSETFNGLKKYECREKIVKILDSYCLMKEIIPHSMTLPICSRTGDIIEYLPKEQWFLNCRELSSKALTAVQSEALKINPERFVKNWIDWVSSDKDWCVSRQLWWGQQIPAFKCWNTCASVWVAATDEITAKNKASIHLRTLPDFVNAERDTDVLDTWFSSAIYPLVAMGWPESSEKLRDFFPIDLMVTGHDILGFWVNRMVMLSLELTDKIPFKEVLLHGIICDSKGAKMSKSKGNVIDPIDVIRGISLSDLKNKVNQAHKDGILTKAELDTTIANHKSSYSNTNGIPECGVDALRFTLLSNDTKSHFINFDLDQCFSNKLFCNKIWQSIKYLQMMTSKLKICEDEITVNDLTFFDRWILDRLSEMVYLVNESMDNYDFHIATRAIRKHIYNEFCDVYLEATKPGFEDPNPKIGFAHAHTLSAVLNTSLRCLAPFMVYLTNEIIYKIPNFDKNIICNFNDEQRKSFDFPRYKDYESWTDKKFETRVENLLNTVAFVRQLKGIYRLTNRDRPTFYVLSQDEVLKHDIGKNKEIIKHLSKCGDVLFDGEKAKSSCVSAVVNENTSVFLDLDVTDEDQVVKDARAKLEKKISKMEKALANLEAKFRSQTYLTTAPEWNKIVDREKLHTKRKELKELQKFLN